MKTNMKIGKLSKEIIDSSTKQNFKTIITNISEIGLDSILDNGILKDLPIIGTLSKVYDITNNISNRIFIRKLAMFISNASELNLEQITKIKIKIGKITDDKLGESVLLAIEKVDDFEKASILGKLFRAFLVEIISELEFKKLSYAVQIIPSFDFPILLKTMKELQFIRDQVTSRIYSTELFEMPLEIIDENEQSEDSPNGKKYKLSKLGTKFVNIAFYKNIEYKHMKKKEVYEELEID